MQTYEIIVAGRAVRANSADTTLVRTSVGIDKIHVLFDNAEWTGFPVRVTFANGETLVSTSVTLAALESTEWAAEAECTIPWEVIQALGGIRITFQGTDSSGNHIITEASGTPLTVVEAGDVVDGSEPQPDPTVDEWHQAYADAMAAASDAASAAEQVSEILHSTDAQTLEELLAALGSALRFKGSVNAYADLPAAPEQGDVYNVAGAYGDYPAGTNWAWTGTAWDALGGEVDLSAFATKDSPAFAGTPTAPTAASGTDTTQIATTAFVQQEIDANAYELPTMDATTKGGATLGQGLTVSDGALSLGPLVESGSGESVDTQGCALFGVSARGWAQQASTTGKNLLPNTATSQTVSGVTFTVNADGSVHVKGTATARVNFMLNGATRWAMDDGEYVLSGTSSQNTNVILEISTSGSNYYSVNNSRHSIAFTLSDETISAYITVYSGNTVDSVVYPQLEAGSTATSYEPYTGGAPSPSPDYPQPIEVARGRNLLSRDAFVVNDMSNHGPKHIDADGYVSADITTSDQRAFSYAYRSFEIMLDAGTYTISFDKERACSNSAGGYRIYLSDDTLITSSDSTFQPRTFTLNSRSTIGIVMKIYDGVVACQLELGSTPTPYVPYGHVGLEVQGRNLAKPNYGSDKNGTFSGITWEYQGDGVWHASGTSASNNARPANGTQTYITDVLEAGTYVVSAKASDGTYVDAFVRTQTGNVEVTSGATPLVFSVEDGTDLRISPAIHYGTTIDADITLQLERGGTDTAWAPYADPTCTPIPLPSKGWAGGLPDGTADALTVDSAGRYEWTCVSDEISASDTTWEINSTSVTGWFRSSNLPNCKSIANSAIAPAMSDSYRIATVNQTYNNNWHFGIDYNGRIILLDNRASTVDALIALFAVHEPVFLYPLATPTTEHGYIDLPDLPSGARVFIPELEGFACSWWVEGADAVVEHAENMARRNEEIEDALAELAARVAALEA